MEYTSIDGHKLICGDIKSALNEHVADGSVDLIFIDPPYNIGKKFHNTVDKWKSDHEYLDWCYDLVRQ